MSSDRYWVIDVEGNGASPPEIVELAMIELSALVPTGKQFHWLVKPSQPIQPAVTRIHGLTDDDIADAPEIADIADEILTWTQNGRIIGHNVRVELETIQRQIPEWRPVAAIDTLKLARSLKPGLDSYGLEKLGSFFGLIDEAARRTNRKHHSALFDAMLTALIFADLLMPLEQSARVDCLRDADVLFSRQSSFL
ncbi:3'-5' exonuclease [Mesorhizobium sp. VK25A]|uniref:3'-5' exonuclease n=2 Tax=Mesorhizobium TaxID=68287 RepID=A0ABU5ADI9_9HYPH|nr:MULTISPECIES: 3'-5' exonuclease [unclassified Mesorhizobium]MDX8469800.1 3'-5' exonuclease [Mesorhizobium sp. VK23B]MDX8476139.1 3'-5' exonuclease [Mesorhizobium sp. VK23A]MDX8508392.1 3'-5' exonuclease [Mesorhizobium sp. VK22E]MDX8535343.1 3'-5' exonuclease [Mesorhizobium sp. VK25D]MDX8546843.1 3'-5' exonuclease [Mesorhizobium sp. VK25A]